MTVIGIGDLQMANGEKFCGLVIQASREELQAVAGNVLYKKVKIMPDGEEDIASGENGNFWDEKFAEMVEALCAIDKRVREAKPSQKYTRDEVLAMLDEIDPSKKNESEGAE